MRTSIAALLLLAAAVLAPSAEANPLRDAARQDGSFAWRIPTKGTSVCCCEADKWSNRKSYVEYDEIILVASVEKGRIEHLRMVEPTCPVTARRIDGVSAEASLEFLMEHLTDDKRVIGVIGVHDHPRAVEELVALARRHESTRIRREAIFWLGQRAGEKAAGELRRAVDEDPEDEVRERAVFAISQLPADRAVPLLTDLVKNHKRPIVRQRAMFWLAQTNDPRALAVIEEILGIK